MRLAAFMLLLFACADTRPTGMRIRTDFAPELTIDQLFFFGALADDPLITVLPAKLAPDQARKLNPHEDLVVVLDEKLDGKRVIVRVDGLSAGVLVGSGRAIATIVGHTVADLEVTLGAPAVCGDGILQSHAEDCDDGCPGCMKSAACIEACGDGLCCLGAGESTCTCALDCGMPVCGDGVCCDASGENSCSCESDCGAPTCGDGTCCGSETACTCAQDCGASSEGPKGAPTCTDEVDNDCDGDTDSLDAECGCGSVCGACNGCCARKCTGSCAVVCDGACECNVDCSNATGKCEGACRGTSTCNIDCSAANACDFECRNFSHCNIDCTGAHNCKPIKCRDDAICFVDCRGADSCDDYRCEGRAECYLECDGGKCSCTGGRTCPSGLIACNGAPCL